MIDLTERINRIISAWEHHAPHASFAGFTLQQFKAAVAASLESRAALSVLATRAVGLKAQRDLSDKTARVVADRVVAGVRADGEFGADSSLWAAMGFVRVSDRSTGLTRKNKRRAAPSAVVTDAETAEESA